MHWKGPGEEGAKSGAVEKNAGRRRPSACGGHSPGELTEYFVS